MNKEKTVDWKYLNGGERKSSFSDWKYLCGCYEKLMIEDTDENEYVHVNF